MEDKALSEEVLVRLNLQSQSLGCVVAQIDFNEKRNCSLFHWQIFKSRFLALHYPEIFASPVPQSYQEFQEILVVAHRDLIENGQVDSYLREARLSKKRWTLKASSEAIQSTLRFTIIARLSPEWNAIACKAVSGSKNGELLFRGRDFLTEAAKSPVDTVRIRVFVADGVAWLGLCACRSRLPTIRLEDLEISSRDIETLFAHPRGSVSENQIFAPWVHVIPSLKRGRVTHISKGFPIDCVFKNYEDLCKHWRRTYGIILPPSDPSVTPVFASVSFLMGGRPFLYPMECLLKSCPLWLRHITPEPVILGLVESMRKCFRTDVIVEIAGRPVAQLLPAGQSKAEQSYPNVLSGPLTDLLHKKPTPLVNVDEEMSKEVSPKPPPNNAQLAGLHFMSNLSTKVRRPLAELSLNLPPHSAQCPQDLQKPRPVVPVIPRGKPIFRPICNASSSSNLQEKPRVLVQPKGKPVFQLSNASSSSNLQEKPRVLVQPKEKPVFQLSTGNASSSSNLQAKARSLIPPKGIFRPTDGGTNKVTKKATERKQSQQKSTADIESLFKVGTLRKATVAQLQMWLCKNGFETKGRAKKDDLVDRVSAELRSQQKENATTRTSANQSLLMSHLQKLEKEPKPYLQH